MLECRMMKNPFLIRYYDIQMKQFQYGRNWSRKVVILTGIDEIHLKCDFNNGNAVHGIRRPFFLV